VAIAHATPPPPPPPLPLPLLEALALLEALEALVLALLELTAELLLALLELADPPPSPPEVGSTSHPNVPDASSQRRAALPFDPARTFM